MFFLELVYWVNPNLKSKMLNPSIQRPNVRENKSLEVPTVVSGKSHTGFLDILRIGIFDGSGLITTGQYKGLMRL